MQAASQTPQQSQVAQQKAPEPAAGDGKHPDEAGISGAPVGPAGQRVVAREERVEYRDQFGNTLNEEQVKALELSLIHI